MHQPTRQLIENGARTTRKSYTNTSYLNYKEDPSLLSTYRCLLIGAIGFHQTLTRLNAQLFITSLYKIDQIIEEREMEAIWKDATQDELTNEELIDQKLPSQYSNFKDVFSKAALDVLLLHQEYNLGINLENGTKHSLGFSLLYYYSTKELKAYKQYFIENISKGFIV